MDRWTQLLGLPLFEDQVSYGKTCVYRFLNTTIVSHSLVTYLFPLLCSPVNDLSLEMEGGVAKDGHLYANAQWGYIVKKQSTAWGRFVDKNIPDTLDVPRRARVTVSEFPTSTTAEFPPFYRAKKKPERMLRGPGAAIDGEFVPVITMGRYGVILKKHRPSDAAIVALIDSAQTIIRFAIQDIGPVCVPGTKLSLPGCVWPEEYLNGKPIDQFAFAPHAVADDLTDTVCRASYSNGASHVGPRSRYRNRVEQSRQYPWWTQSDGGQLWKWLVLCRCCS